MVTLTRTTEIIAHITIMVTTLTTTALATNVITSSFRLGNHPSLCLLPIGLGTVALVLRTARPHHILTLVRCMPTFLICRACSIRFAFLILRSLSRLSPFCARFDP
ncbi:transmembrane protein, putative [Rhizoctonia solani AG-3 Rhs1AP]|uniref:Transmembrane protein, putative n=2 Tax=Rhizoctonia solani AG-3 TaxID=1086053 RepID=A0A0A1UJ95_9AGAM|nr:transmembrane protein, putative [Rhizoctonia solani AG-3 Rhs1AP]KEP46049.1 putative transmembrane protein [Rhizoctonia solani 123E]